MRSFSSFDDYLTDAESDSTSTNHPLRDVDDDSVEVLHEFSIKQCIFLNFHGERITPKFKTDQIDK